MGEYNEAAVGAVAGVQGAPAPRVGRVPRRPQLWLGLMLLSLHAATAWGITDWWPRAFLLTHFGLFLMWQPVWRGERDIEPRYAFLMVVAGFVFVAWNTWWLTAVWLAVLFGLIGGSVPGITDRRQRSVSLLAALYLLSLLLIWVVPHLFVEQAFERALTVLVQYGLPVLPVAIIAIRVHSPQTAARIAVDLFYSVILFLLVAALVLGSFVVKQVSLSDYPLALAQTLFVIAVLLMALSWLWSPRSGFVGLGHMFSRYLMTLGLPFEHWVQRLAELAGQEAQPQRFLAAALEHMQELPWVRGVEWKSRLGEGEFGERSQFAAEMSFRDLSLRIYTGWSLSPAMLLHLKLLTQMVGHFYDAKRREEAQRQRAYTQAIYETGARLTHDVKNLLQSLRSLCAAVETSSEHDARALQGLMQRQLPQITQRLNVTLDKLNAPQQADTSLVDATIWWDALRQRYGHRNVRFESPGVLKNVRLSAELFDSVADNLIENALSKAADTADHQVRVTFAPAGENALTVCDTGAAVPKATAAQLFDAPVSSRTGLGVGLYHAARQAADLGYRLRLVANEQGIVCFSLTRTEDTRPRANA
jgi:signal transduction histidine kinase